MRIASAHLQRIGAHLPAAISNSSASWTTREGLLLELFSEEGLLGQGEASPLPGYSPDTLEECEAALTALNPGDFGEIDLDRPVAAQVRRWLAAHPLPPAARFAAETALLNLVALRTQRPSTELLGSLLGSPVSPHSVPLSALGVLRREVGPEIQLRLDANGAFLLAEASQRLEALAELRPEFIEEPVPLGQLAAFAERAKPAIPLAADESLSVAALRPDLMQAFATQRIAVAVLKPTLLGGALTCLDLASELLRLGAKLTVTHAFEGPIALTSAMALASVLPGPVLAAGLDRHLGLDLRPGVWNPA
jgi:L-alanine-DL-glutamate epimerase-like enolase superfamily enzyme